MLNSIPGDDDEFESEAIMHSKAITVIVNNWCCCNGIYQWKNVLTVTSIL